MFSKNCTNKASETPRLQSFGIGCLACVLLCVLMYNNTTPLLAQEQQSAVPEQEAVADTTDPGTQNEPERIQIRIEFPIVEPLFDIYYSREEPRIEADDITPIANPLQTLPTVTEEAPDQNFQAKKLENLEFLLNRRRE